ncbi:calcium-binding protein [Phyllobacterium zundukense]|jgi:Ca2+-binding RTX toxin-like protein|uniref:calcium-binding protein n=1 Tax=Phyllobacterium zundukense TaxID=1867719 RepID=UPI00290564DB|nr:calcium-binding protein [Phyllobacterium zundukense]
MAINPQVQALFSVLGITTSPNQITGIDGNLLPEILNGTSGSDYMLGLGGIDTLNGGGGNDYLEGGMGADVLVGGSAANTQDTLGYATAGSAVNVTLVANGLAALVGGAALGDVATGFENVVGSGFADTITGDNLANVLAGLDGDDTLNGGGGDDTLIGGDGADRLNGGDGIDTVDYSGSILNVDVDLYGSSGSEDAVGDIYQAVENAVGGSANDTLDGNDDANRLDGGGGNDWLRGNEGNDILIGGLGSDMLTGGDGFRGSDSGGSDKFQYRSLAEILSNDVIKAFFKDDFIDLSMADADPNTAGRQPFHFGPGVGQIEYSSGLSPTIHVTGESGGINVMIRNTLGLEAYNFIF